MLLFSLALIVVGCLMVTNVHRVDWDDWTEAFPAFLVMVVYFLGLLFIGRYIFS